MGAKVNDVGKKKTENAIRRREEKLDLSSSPAKWSASPTKAQRTTVCVVVYSPLASALGRKKR